MRRADAPSICTAAFSSVQSLHMVLPFPQQLICVLDTTDADEVSYSCSEHIGTRIAEGEFNGLAVDAISDRRFRPSPTRICINRQPLETSSSPLV
jgi:hypothetical protein